MSTQRLLQPLWELILSKCGNVVSYWLFPWLLGSTVYMETALYFTTKDIGPWKSEKTRIHSDTWPSVRKIINVGWIQVAAYTIFNTLLWYALPYFNVLPKEAPTLLEFVCDLSTTKIISDFLIFINHFMHNIRWSIYTKRCTTFITNLQMICFPGVQAGYTPSRSQLLSSLWCYTRGFCFQCILWYCGLTHA